MSEYSRGVERAVEAINQVFGDTSVSKEETLERLQEIAEGLAPLIEMLQEELRADGES